MSVDSQLTKIAAALRPYFDGRGRPLVFPEGHPPIPDDVLHPAEDHRLVMYRYGTGWSIEDTIRLTSRGREALGMPKLTLRDRIAGLFSSSLEPEVRDDKRFPLTGMDV